MKEVQLAFFCWPDQAFGRSHKNRLSWFNLRRPGRDRDRERTAIRRSAGAHSGAFGITINKQRRPKYCRLSDESPGDLTPVFDTMVESAMRLCQADYGHVYSYDGKLLHLVAAHGDPGYVNWIKESGPRTPEVPSRLRNLEGEPLVHLADISTYHVLTARANQRAKTQSVDQFDIHTLLTVPMRKEENSSWWFRAVPARGEIVFG